MEFEDETCRDGFRKLNLTLLLLLLMTIYDAKAEFKSEKEFEKFVLTEYERNQTEMCYDFSIASWEFNTDIANATKEEFSALKSSQFAAATEYFYLTYFKDLHKLNLTKEWSKRHMKHLTRLGDISLPREEYEQLTDILNEMLAVYSGARVCPYSRKVCVAKHSGLPLDPDIEDIMSSSRNVTELAYYWDQYRAQTGLRIKEFFKQYVVLKNKAAKLDHYSDAGDSWRSEYETPNFAGVVDALWNEVKPVYDELHFYVLHKLAKYYGDRIDVSDGLIPAHLTGDMHSHSWANIVSRVLPFPKAGSINITSALYANNYTALKMFETANEFYTSMGLEDMSTAFGSKGLIERPSSRAVVCHPTAWEFCTKTDFRISMCTKIAQRDFRLVHHELGHVLYYLQYRDQPITFRDAPNPAFHEAIGEAIVLSVVTPAHLKQIGLLGKKYKITEESTINYLMSVALDFVTLLPYALILDKWRWGIFNGSIAEADWNDVWWTYRKTVQKIKPPVGRSARDFDPGSKYHVAADVQYISYFIATIIQFQVYRELCIVADKYHPGAPFTAPLHECDFYDSIRAGNKLKSGLKLGSSVHWSQVLKVLTGEAKLSTKAMLEYFHPLMEFLVSENEKTRKSVHK